MNRPGKGAALLLVGASTAVILVGALPIAAGLVGAPTLAALAGPAYRRLAAHVAPRASALGIVIVAWICLVLPVGWLARTVVHQAPVAVEQVHRAAEKLPSSMMIGTVPADTVVSRAAAQAWTFISQSIGPALGAGARVVTDLSIALIGLYFLLIGGETPWTAVREWLPFSAEGSDSLRGTFISVTRSTVFGSMASAAVQGTSIGVGLWLTGNDAPVFWGAVAAFWTLVPIVGNAVVWIPAVVLTVVHHDYRATVVMAFFGKILPALLDQVVKIRIARRLSSTHPLITLLGALIGVHLVGAVGVLAGPAMLQCTLELAAMYRREYAPAVE